MALPKGWLPQLVFSDTRASLGTVLKKWFCNGVVLKHKNAKKELKKRKKWAVDNWRKVWRMRCRQLEEEWDLKERSKNSMKTSVERMEEWEVNKRERDRAITNVGSAKENHSLTWRSRLAWIGCRMESAAFLWICDSPPGPCSCRDNGAIQPKHKMFYVLALWLRNSLDVYQCEWVISDRNVIYYCSDRINGDALALR